MSGVFAAELQSIIDNGLGLAGEFVGTPFVGSRCEQNSNGDFPGWTKPLGVTPQLVRRVRITNFKIDDPVKSSGTVYYNLIGNMSRNLVGDVFINTDPAFVDGASYGPGATSFAGDTSGDFDGFCLCWRPPVGKPIGARVNRFVQIYRAVADNGNSTPGTETDWDVTKKSGAVVGMTITGGVAGFGGTVAHRIPVGFAASERPNRQTEYTAGQSTPPTATEAPRFYLYIPPLIGFFPKEGDVIVDGQGSRYLVTQPWYAATGVAGSQLIIQRNYAGTE